MSPDQINQAIAELLGIKDVCNPKTGLWHLIGNGREYGRGKGLDEDHVWKVCCPNYSTSLDACAEFEGKLSDQVGDYEHYLGEITQTTGLTMRRSFVGERFKLSTATPIQRCEAYLRMKGKWI